MGDGVGERFRHAASGELHPPSRRRRRGRRGRQEGLDVQAISINYHSTEPEHGLLLGYAAMDERQILRALLALGQPSCGWTGGSDGSPGAAEIYVRPSENVGFENRSGATLVRRPEAQKTAIAAGLAEYRPLQSASNFCRSTACWFFSTTSSSATSSSAHARGLVDVVDDRLDLLVGVQQGWSPPSPCG